ncbi:YcaO-like family protein [Streptosporangium carneum]|uniref:YcaO domain-containing protein n=1 Tax=Streptosporangium carneum TaxID=47481 RepID=A0A9W6ICH8_9ACTN|nr:YcaO-like family protein [Streptosporangium carneum]GLK14930.1 hypothetical protein GCM10017600_83430 [Streptosporangium carneum]
MNPAEDKIRLPGTHRTRTPEETWAVAKRHLDRVGISRVADVTHLDCIGVPVCLAIRPGSETLAVSQGKGATPLLAKISAVMESIELWHAERPAVETFTASAEELDLPYGLADLRIRTELAPYRDSLRLDWVEGVGTVSGRAVPVPADLVGLTLAAGLDWRPAALHASSNGLASGNSREEAALHAMYELVERHATSFLRPGARDRRRTVRVETITGGHCTALLDALHAAGVDTEVSFVPNEFGLPCFVCFVWSPEYPVLCAGSGCHSNAEVALSRALTEAVQTRLTGISGTRDDIPSGNAALETGMGGMVAPRFDPGGLTWAEAVQETPFDSDSIAAEFRSVAEHVERTVGLEPVMVDISSAPEDFSVVRIVAPGLAYRNRGVIPR